MKRHYTYEQYKEMDEKISIQIMDAYPHTEYRAVTKDGKGMALWSDGTTGITRQDVVDFCEKHSEEYHFEETEIYPLFSRTLESAMDVFYRLLRIRRYPSVKESVCHNIEICNVGVVFVVKCDILRISVYSEELPMAICLFALMFKDALGEKWAKVVAVLEEK